ESHGIPYPPRAERVARVEEAIDVIRALWQDGPVDHRGRFSNLSGALGGPPPVQRPGPPVWIAAMSKHALAMVARQAHRSQPSYLPPREFAERWQRLRRLLAAEHRDPA